MYFNKKKELFISPQMNAKLLNGIKLNMGEIENIDELEIQKLSDDSEKLVILNIIKNYSVKNLLFSKNLELVNYKESNILGNSIDNIGGVASIVSEAENKKIDGQMTNKFELKYNNITLENIHNIPVSFAVGNDFSTDKKNPYYGIQIKYKIKNTSHNNRAEIGIDFKSYMDIPIGKLIEMNEVLQDPDYKNLHREKVEVITKETKKLDFLPYFKNTDIKALVLFKDTKNKEFLNSLEGYFNLVDEKGNRILTKCKLDTPFCKAHILPKGKIYGRDKYIVGKYIPSGNNFQVLGDDEQIAKKKAVDAEKAAANAAAAEEEAVAKAVEKAEAAEEEAAENAKAVENAEAARVAATREPDIGNWTCINNRQGGPVGAGNPTPQATKQECQEKCAYTNKCIGYEFNSDSLQNYKGESDGKKRYDMSCRHYKQNFPRKENSNQDSFQYCTETKNGIPNDWKCETARQGSGQNKNGTADDPNGWSKYHNLAKTDCYEACKNEDLCKGIEVKYSPVPNKPHKCRLYANNTHIGGDWRQMFCYKPEEWNCEISNAGEKDKAYSKLTNTSKEECYKKCEGDGECKGFDYNTDGGFGGETFDCRLYKDNTIRTQNILQSFQYCSKPEDWNCARSKLGDEPYKYSDGDFTIRNYTKDQCKTKCSGDENCKAFDFNTMKLENKTHANGDDYYTTCRLYKGGDGKKVKNESFQYCSKPVEGFVGNFQDKDKEQIPQDYLYQKFLTKKDCVKDIDIHTQKISSSEYLKEPKLDLIANSKTLAPLKRLGGNKCIKHHDEFRDDYFFGGLDKDNNMFCYGKNNDCILFSDKPACEKLNLEKLLSVPLDKSKVKGINYQNDRTYYDKDSLTIKKNKMGATFKDDNGNLEIKCGNGKYLEGTFNAEDELSIIGGIYKDCKDPNHPKHDSCSPSISSSTLHLAELITTKGNKKYEADKSDKYSKFGDLDGKCIDNNIPDGRNIECDPLDNQQPCYVGDRPSLTPGESQPNIDLYNKYLGFNCNTYTLDSNTCKHNNNGVLSDVISFSTPLEENYLNIMDEQEILEVSNNLEENLMSDSEKYDSKNLHFYIEKYFERYENMNPNNHINPRYTIKFDTQYDMLSKNDKVILNIYYKGEKETTLLNNSEETYSIEDDDIIEILLQKNNHLVFKIRRDTTDLVKYTSIHKLEGEYSSPINFFISQNNNSFFRDIKYKEEIPSTVLPYNPFIDVRQE